jgi:tRNA (guanosine-2'-O-)-methyltransferase
MKMTNTANDPSDDATRRREERIACLAEFMREERFATLRRAVSMRTGYMTVLAENTFHGQNAAALIRHCEAFGVQRMHTVESCCKFEPSAAVVRGTDRWVDVVRHASTEEAVAALRGAGYRIVATTPHREDTTPETFDVGAGPFALVFGTEHAGISEGIVAAADEFLRIPMCGMVESLNVSASAAILIYQLAERVRSTVGEWRLTEEERTEVLYRWMRTSVADAAAILHRRFGDPL